MTLSDHAIFAADGVYRPILRARRGEVLALHHLDPQSAHRVLPILELSIPARDTAHEAVDLMRLLHDARPRSPAIAIDVGNLPDPADPLRSAPLEVAEDLGEHGVSMVPVVRPHDSGRRLAEHGLAARIHNQHALLRLRPADTPGPLALGAVVDRVLRGTGLSPEEFDLVLDLAETGCHAGVDRVEEQARRTLRWAHGRRWRSVSVAAGAMPANLDDLPTDQPVEVERWDRRLIARLADTGAGYADYGVTSPVRRGGLHHRQLPTLRYTDEASWWIYRWARRGGRGDDRCHDLCRALLASPQWPAAGARFSWGDAEIARRARTARGAGTPANWIAWSTSHHIAQVLSSGQLQPRPRQPGTRSPIRRHTGRR
ncbi:MAG TPA: beta family protein [Actinoplanes sp.]|nr:beta family protein [Actinoplanes sp.]